ncbi:unnamed protein product [Rhizoctonia solani]|uniref:Homeobox domain-containing protein n=1 Tax=Rhizoctonia solani TaxID=456999 RepID=A0A8H3DQJ2_9AGAM|nr:unnamed protein product [Rhizoctonia solani]
MQEGEASSLGEINIYSPPQYRPQDPSLHPYWDAFYENPYPDADERKTLAARLGMSTQTIQQWFIMARIFTHAPDNKPNDDYDATKEEESDEEEISNEGTSYKYFYRDIFAQKSTNREESYDGHYIST